MTENALAKKLKLKPAMRAALLGAPEGYRAALGPLPEGVQISEELEGQFDWVQLFARSQAELSLRFPQALAALKPEGLLWVSFPKGSSKIQTDLTRDKGWEIVQQADLKWVVLISVDPVWSAFAVRPFRPDETRGSFR